MCKHKQLLFYQRDINGKLMKEHNWFYACVDCGEHFTVEEQSNLENKTK